MDTDVTEQSADQPKDDGNVFASLDTEERWKCPGCDTVFEEDELEPVYECGSCGTVFNRSESQYESHRCDCGKFASKITAFGCPDACHEECEPVVGSECPICGDFIEEDDYITHSEGHAA